MNRKNDDVMQVCSIHGNVLVVDGGDDLNEAKEAQQCIHDSDRLQAKRNQARDQGETALGTARGHIAPLPTYDSKA